ncbi:MAG: AraC family transcriptional regulator ligand-binding domain-containing protein [Myxococcota bacterium]
MTSFPRIMYILGRSDMRLLVHPIRVDHALEGARARGLDVAPLLEAAGMEPRGGADMIPIQPFLRLMWVVQAALDDEYLGLTARPLRKGAHGLIAAHASQATCLLEAYERVTRFLNILDLGIEHTLVSSRGEVRHEVRPTETQGPVHQLSMEIALVVPHSLLSWLGGHRIPINRVSLDFHPPVEAHSYRWVFGGAPTRYGQACTSLSIPAPALRRRVQRTEAQALAWGARFPSDIFLSHPPLEGLALEVANAVEGLLESGQRATIESVAIGLGLEPYTLRRRLKDRGLAFIHLRTEVKREFATRLLVTTTLTVEEISERVGFGQPSAFVRAFRGWTGLTPRAYRAGDTA